MAPGEKIKILLLSDSHSNINALVTVLLQNNDADVIIHCGDGQDDLDGFMPLLYGKSVYRVEGNWHTYGATPRRITTVIGGRTFYISHGFDERVKTDLTGLKYRAALEKADIVCYGHTHQQHDETDSGVRYINPGAVFEGRYAVIELTDEDVNVTMW
ncbi:MAG: YfcE family phosphodiesterase [Clostridia bacterium]|nr:YfcE family phosphodiesterase [Clostridia bacterium]